MSIDELQSTLEEFVGSGGLPSGQVAVARDGALLAEFAAGNVVCAGKTCTASGQTLYHSFSTTKAVVSSALWLCIQDGKLEASQAVAEWIPEFAENDKGSVRIEHLLTHTAGFPDAPFKALEWEDRARRRARFASWRLDWAPGSRFTYHPTSSMWVVAELIERASGGDFRDFVRARVTEPLGLKNYFLSLPESEQHRVADVAVFGDEADAEALRGAGLAIPRDILAGASLLEFNAPEIRAIGTPSGGGITNAADLALFYQGLLHGRASGGDEIWNPETLREGLRVRTGDLIDPMTKRAANRSLGLVIAGDEQRVFRSFAPGNSPEAFGHAGAGGQIAWGDPASGLSFAFLTHGAERNPLRMGARILKLSSLAASLD